MSQAGLPDLMAVKDGLFIAIEVKNERGKATPLQLNTLVKFREQHILAFVARIVQDVKDMLELLFHTDHIADTNKMVNA
jgi:Holliday junction resolvase